MQGFQFVLKALFLNNILRYCNNYLVKICILVFRF